MKLPYSEENLAMLLRQSPAPPDPTGVAAAELEDGQDTVADVRRRAVFSQDSPKRHNKGVDIVGKIGDPSSPGVGTRRLHGLGLRGYASSSSSSKPDLSVRLSTTELLVKEGQKWQGARICRNRQHRLLPAKLHFGDPAPGQTIDPLRLLDRPS